MYGPMGAYIYEREAHALKKKFNDHTKFQRLQSSYRSTTAVIKSSREESLSIGLAGWGNLKEKGSPDKLKF